MATLKQVETGAVRPVPSRMLVGRAASCALRLDDKHVSGEHATLAWTGADWVLRDLGSRNGTFVDGERLEPGATRTVAKGSSLGFGRTGGFVMVDDGAPAALAEDPSGRLVVAEDGILALPDGSSPEVVVYADARGAWVAERGDDVGPVTDGEAVMVGGRAWTVRLPASLEGTATIDAGPTLDTVRLRFAVSMDEEHVEIAVVHRGKETRLEAREHGYILLTLARARLADAELPLAEQGWLDRDRLLKMLGTDSNALNVGIYRARGQLGAAGVDGAAAVVQVRRGQRRFGIEPDRIEITSL
ncbi:MAG: FHA domain-containing protein [Alphaproteobacteria bacterium]|nr:FHA domain-containing protein [Alphaproteobacteria bacterium]